MIEQYDLSERGRKLREQTMNSEPSICAQRLRIITRAYQQYENEPVIIKRAKALYDILNEMDIYILDDELIVGNQGSSPRCAPLFPEFSSDWVEREIDSFSTRKADRFMVSEQDKKEIKELLQYWKGKGTKDKALAILPELAKDCHSSLVFILTSLASVTGHIIIDNQMLLGLGLIGVKDRIKKYRESLDYANPEDIEKIVFYTAAEIACDAVINFAGRYAALARSKAEKEKDPVRKNELLKIARVCENVPAYPAQNFHEAVQSVWMAQLILQIESQGHGISLGRFDQYVYPYYQKSIEAGEICAGDAYEIIESFFVKLNEVNKARDGVASLAFGGYPMYQNLMVGGIDTLGRDCTNDISYLCADATRNLQLPQPSFSVRVHRFSPRELLRRSIDIVRTGVGMPAFFNDDALVPTIMDLGVCLKEARDYGIVSCVEPQVPGKTEGYDAGGFLNISKVIEITLNNGTDPRTGLKLGLETGEADSFTSFDDFMDAYNKQVEHFAKLQVQADNVIDMIHGQWTPMPFRCLFVHDCLERGKVIETGGAVHNYTACNPVGLANAADSMAVLKKLVFETKEVPLAVMRDALNANFEGHEELRQRCINGVEKYGNDHDFVDNLAFEVANAFFKAYTKYRNPRGGRYHPGLQSASTHALFVDAAGATPDGRVVRDLLADGGVSAAQGRDKKGPTALINSVAKLDHYSATNGTLLNIKFHPSAVEGEAGCNNLLALLRTFFDRGGHHVQFNCTDSKMLRDAQANPEKYPSLVVRVAGFSVLFSSIDKTLQDDIINRTEQTIA